MNALALPSPIVDLSAIDRADLSESTKTKYRRTLQRFFAAGISPDQLPDYAAGLSQSEKAFLKAGLRIISKDKADALKAGATPENVAAIQALLWRIESLSSAIHVKASKGDNKKPNWLSAKQVKQLTALAADNKQDWLCIALMVAAGLRRDEVVRLTFGNIGPLPVKDQTRTVLEVRGKGDKRRVVPVSKLLAERLEEWRKIRTASESDRVIPISPQRVFQIVRRYGKKVGAPKLAPHDLRRTFAQFASDGGLDLEHIKALLGHESVKTTERYLNRQIKLDVTGSDFVPLSGD